MRKAQNIKTYIKTTLTYVLLFSLIMLLIWIVYDNNITLSEQNHISILIGFTIILLISMIFMRGYKWVNWYNMILASGIFMRIWYTLWTSYDARTHDLGELSSNAGGHASYIIKLFTDGKLPTSNSTQFYHPPLYHYLCAGVLKVFSWFHPEDDFATTMQITKTISCFAMCMSLIVMGKICEELCLSKRVQTVVMLIMAFFPAFYLISGYINNDGLAFMFIMYIIYFSIKWYYKKKTSDIVGLGLCLGLGMMTKINVAMMALPLAILFVTELIKSIKRKNSKKYIIQYLVFAGISMPLGVWYPIRNWILFKQPVSYVWDVSGRLKSLSAISWIKRVLPVDWSDFFSPIYLSSEEYNMPKYLIKSSLFGEFTFEGIDMASILLICVNIMMSVLVVAGLLYLVCSYRKKRKVLSLSIVAMWVMWMVSYVTFNIKYPYFCTMNYRYIITTSFFGAIALAIMADHIYDNKRLKYVAIGIYGIIGVFVLLSIYCFSLIV